MLYGMEIAANVDTLLQVADEFKAVEIAYPFTGVISPLLDLQEAVKTTGVRLYLRAPEWLNLTRQDPQALQSLNELSRVAHQAHFLGARGVLLSGGSNPDVETVSGNHVVTSYVRDNLLQVTALFRNYGLRILLMNARRDNHWGTMAAISDVSRALGDSVRCCYQPRLCGDGVTPSGVFSLSTGLVKVVRFHGVLESRSLYPEYLAMIAESCDTHEIPIIFPGLDFKEAVLAINALETWR